eukprot:scaffold7386_cov509-Prasinococcus_capsulatus_cf.AAC.10
MLDEDGDEGVSYEDLVYRIRQSREASIAAAKGGRVGAQDVLCKLRLRIGRNQRSMVNLFKEYDRDQSGALDYREIWRLLRHVLPGLSMKEKRYILANMCSLDVNNAGEVAYAELSSAMFPPRVKSGTRSATCRQPDDGGHSLEQKVQRMPRKRKSLDRQIGTRAPLPNARKAQQEAEKNSETTMAVLEALVGQIRQAGDVVLGSQKKILDKHDAQELTTGPTSLPRDEENELGEETDIQLQLFQNVCNEYVLAEEHALTSIGMLQPGQRVRNSLQNLNRFKQEVIHVQEKVHQSSLAVSKLQMGKTSERTLMRLDRSPSTRASIMSLKKRQDLVLMVKEARATVENLLGGPLDYSGLLADGYVAHNELVNEAQSLSSTPAMSATIDAGATSEPPVLPLSESDSLALDPGAAAQLRASVIWRLKGASKPDDIETMLKNRGKTNEPQAVKRRRMNRPAATEPSDDLYGSGTNVIAKPRTSVETVAFGRRIPPPPRRAPTSKDRKRVDGNAGSVDRATGTSTSRIVQLQTNGDPVEKLDHSTSARPFTSSMVPQSILPGARMRDIASSPLQPSYLANSGQDQESLAMESDGFTYQPPPIEIGGKRFVPLPMFLVPEQKSQNKDKGNLRSPDANPHLHDEVPPRWNSLTHRDLPDDSPVIETPPSSPDPTPSASMVRSPSSNTSVTLYSALVLASRLD